MIGLKKIVLGHVAHIAVKKQVYRQAGNFKVSACIESKSKSNANQPLFLQMQPKPSICLDQLKLLQLDRSLSCRLPKDKMLTV